MRKVLIAFVVVILQLSFQFNALSQAEGGNTLSLGVILPLSGPLAFVGEDVRRGMEIAINKYENSRLRIKFEDDGYKGTNAASAAQRLLTIDRVDLLVSLWDMAEIVAPVSERLSKPHISIRWDSGITSRFKYTFTFEATAESYVTFMSKIPAFSSAERLAILTEESVGWNLAREKVKEIIKSNNQLLVFDDTFNAGVSDFRSEISKAILTQPNVFILNCVQPELGRIIRTIRELSPKADILGFFQGIDNPALVEGIPYVSLTDTAPWFKQAFKLKYGEDFKIRASHGYDIVGLLDQATHTKEYKLSSADLISYLNSISDYKGASGALTTNKTQNIETAVSYEVFNGGTSSKIHLEDMR